MFSITTVSKYEFSLLQTTAKPWLNLNSLFRGIKLPLTRMELAVHFF